LAKIISIFKPKKILIEGCNESHVLKCLKNKNYDFLDKQYYDYPKSIYDKIQNKIKLTKLETHVLNERIQERTKNHLELIKKQKERTLIILGSWHLRHESELIKEHPDSIIIYPGNERGELVFEPKKEIVFWIKENEKILPIKKIFDDI